MNLQDQINHDIKDAMKEKNVDKLAALRSLKSAIMLEATKDGKSLVSDDTSLKIIARLVKQRKDSAAIYLEQSRKDLSDDELNQLVYLEHYLPDQLEESEVIKIVDQVIDQLDATSPSDIGKCMGLLMGKLKGRAEGSLISRLVKEKLSN